MSEHSSRLPGLLRRVRVSAGNLALLGVLSLVAALLVTGAPRLANRYADQGLGQDIGPLPHQVRDLTYTTRPNPHAAADPTAAADLDTIRTRLPDPLPALIGQQWFAAQVGPESVRISGPGWPENCPPVLPLRYQTGVEPAARMVQGRWPASQGTTVEAVVSAAAADVTGLRVGSAFTMTGNGGGTVRVHVVGVYEPVDPAAPIWADLGPVDATCPEGLTRRAAVLTDPAGLAEAARRVEVLHHEWRYRIAEERLTTAALPALLTAVASSGRTPPEPGLSLVTGLDTALAAFAAQHRSVQALLAVVQAGVLATLFGLVLLAARLAVERRRTEFSLLRARGATAVGIGLRTLRETGLVLPAGTLAGWLLGRLVPGRASKAEWLVLAVAAVTTLAVPVLAALGQRRLQFVARRRDLVGQRPSARRITAEAVVLLLAVVGLMLLRRRGLGSGGTVDPYLVSVPVLLALGAALVTLRIVPWPLRQLGRLAARGRGAVPFIGLARAGRSGPGTVGPLAVLVVAIATGVFTGVLTGSVAQTRDRVTDQEIAADARLRASYTAPGTAERLAELPGVTAVSPLAVEAGQPLRTRSADGIGGQDLGQAQVLVVDGPALARVLAASGIDLRLPAALTRPGRIDGPAPAVVSPEVAADIGTDAATEVQGRAYEFTVAAVLPRFPGLEIGARRFVVLPWQALPVPDFQPIAANGFLVAGDGFATAELRDVVDAGQREYLARVLGRPVAAAEPPVPVSVTTWQEHRRTLEHGGVNRLLSFTFATGTIGATVLALLAVGFAVLAEAPSRGRALARLRTLGLSVGQGRGLLVFELAPLVGIAVLVGGAVGVALCRLLPPALGLANFTAGLGIRIHVDPLLVAGVLLLVMAALAAALAVENAFNRRSRLGEVLRLGEEN